MREVLGCEAIDPADIAPDRAVGTTKREDCSPVIDGVEVGEGVGGTAEDVLETEAGIAATDCTDVGREAPKDGEDKWAGLEEHNLECSLRQVLWKYFRQEPHSDGLACDLKIALHD